MARASVVASTPGEGGPSPGPPPRTCGGLRVQVPEAVRVEQSAVGVACGLLSLVEGVGGGVVLLGHERRIVAGVGQGSQGGGTAADADGADPDQGLGAERAQGWPC
jgi:hypothetical protein